MHPLLYHISLVSFRAKQPLFHVGAFLVEKRDQYQLLREFITEKMEQLQTLKYCLREEPLSLQRVFCVQNVA